MNEHGMYDGWTRHAITIRPTFDGIDVRIGGRDRNGIKEYLADVYREWAHAECTHKFTLPAHAPSTHRNDTMNYAAEYTDTFAGEANYGWVRRATFAAPADASDALLVRRAKRALGITGRHAKSGHGDCIVLSPVGECTVVFITDEGI
jgi:hypothetical protein